jgi:hypothetical protein
MKQHLSTAGTVMVGAWFGAIVPLLACDSSGTLAEARLDGSIDGWADAGPSADSTTVVAPPDAAPPVDGSSDAGIDARVDAATSEAGPCGCTVGIPCNQGICLGCTGPTVFSASATGDPYVAGFPSALAVSGSTILVGASAADQGAGALYVFTQNGGAWSYATKISPPAGTRGFGSSVAMSASRALVSAVSAVFAYDQTAAGWQGPQTLALPDAGAAAPAVVMDGDTAAIAWPGPESGAVSHDVNTYAYVQTAGQWSLQATLSPSQSEIDRQPNGLIVPPPGVAIFGDLIARLYFTFDISGGNDYWADAFLRSGTTWTERQSVDLGGAPANMTSLALSGDTIVFAQYGSDYPSLAAIPEWDAASWSNQGHNFDLVYVYGSDDYLGTGLVGTPGSFLVGDPGNGEGLPDGGQAFLVASLPMGGLAYTALPVAPTSGLQPFGAVVAESGSIAVVGTQPAGSSEPAGAIAVYDCAP